MRILSGRHSVELISRGHNESAAGSRMASHNQQQGVTLMRRERTSRFVWKSLVGCAVVVTTMSALMRFSSIAYAAPAAGEITYTRNIAPILQRSCENCHRADGVAPMPLSTYEEVRPWARAI